MTLEEGIEALPKDKRNAYKEKHSNLYNSFMENYRSKISKSASDLLNTTSRDDFLNTISKNKDLSSLSNLFEAILFSSNHSKLKKESEKEDDPEKAYLKSLVEIYQPKFSSQDECLRRQTILETVDDAAKYVSAYNSNTGNRNPEGLDDGKVIFGGDVTRLSIHKKDPALGQFTISAGNNPHKTPWHSTALLKERKGALIPDNRLAAELKVEGYKPVMAKPSDNPKLPWVNRLAKSGQPMFWVEPSSIKDGQTKEDFTSLKVSL